VPNPVYGDPLIPEALGSGGSRGYYGEAGGAGGGWVWIHAGNLKIDGWISAGGGGGGGNNAGSGSGGSILVYARGLSGAGVVRADGGAHQVGGGGGRVALHYTAAESDITGLNATAIGGTVDGAASRSGQNGTVELLPGKITPPTF
jgi:hypothetical protein